MRCVYCRPPRTLAWHGQGVSERSARGPERAARGHASADSSLPEPPGRELLTPVELERLVRHLVQRHGLRKVRLTGGEPTSRADLGDIVARLAAIAGLGELAMTTNGLTLAGQARALAAAGLHRVNVSLDSLDAACFARLTGVAGLGRVLAGITEARAAGLGPVKLNTVVIGEENDDELPALVRFAAREDLEIRFIELMPMGPLAGQWAERFVSEAQMRARLGEVVTHWQALPQAGDAARRYQVTLADGATAHVGFITAVSCPFCAGCDRIRITAAGRYYPCLMDEPAGDLLPALRPGFDAEELDRRLAAGLGAKAVEHPPAGVAAMIQLGG